MSGSNLTSCQPGWLAVFEAVGGDGVDTEPVACWLLVATPHITADVRPICALGGDMFDATQAENYLGVVGPGIKPQSLLDTKAPKRSA